MKVARLSFMLVALALLGSLTVNAQVREYEYRALPNAPIVDFSTTSSSITVPDAVTINTLSVIVNIEHPAASDLTITLSGPTGNYTLSTQNGLAGANYENTIFDSNPGTAIPGVAINSPTNVTAYFRGVYIPESALPVSGNTAGTWTLNVSDNLLGDNGKLVSWGLFFNRYDNYRDIRWGMDLNNQGVTTLNPFGLVEDITIIPPYTVLGHRPMANQVPGVALFQLGQTPGIANFTIDHRYPNANRLNVVETDLSIPAEGAYNPVAFFNLQGQVGHHEAILDVFMRGDLFTTSNDNVKNVPLHVTAGSLAYDNGKAMNTLFPFINECDALTYDIYAPQTITSVDIWQGSVVELEPNPSTSQMTINVWDQNTNALVATTGPVAFPPQGEKWVSYPFSPPVVLPAGQYRIGYCLTSVQAGSFGPGIGMDEAGSPFEPLGPFSRLADLNRQWFSFDGGSSWNVENFRQFSTQMIRPNFVQQSDVGVIAINSNNTAGGLNVDVTFGAYAHYSYLPNQITFGRVTVMNNTGATIASLEKRVYLTAAPYVETVSFNFNTLTSGAYTIKAEIIRPDDENLINNEYSRQLVIPFAPMMVNTDGPIARDLKDRIISEYAQQGIQVEFVDRTLGNVTLPTNGKVLWVGSLDNASAAQAREFVLNGGDFAVLADVTAGNPMTETFKAVATGKEIESMNSFLTLPTNVNRVSETGRSFVDMMSNPENEMLSITKGNADLNSRINAYFSTVKQDAPTMLRDTRSVQYTNNGTIRTVAERLNDLTVVRLVARNVKAAPQVEAISNPAKFELTQNYPNPFNPTTNVAYNVPADANVSIRVFDLLGREVATLVSGFHAAGSYITNWNSTNNLGQIAPSGIYLYRMEASPVDGSAPYVQGKKMILAR